MLPGHALRDLEVPCGRHVSPLLGIHRDPFWEYGAFIDVRDLSQARICALRCDVARFACLLVSSPDITTSGSTSRQLAEFVLPDVEWRGGAEYQAEPFRSLVEIENAKRTLAWTPKHSWQSHVERNA